MKTLAWCSSGGSARLRRDPVRGSRVWLCVVVGALAIGGAARAQRYWDGGGEGDNDWGNRFNWTADAEPTGSDNCYIGTNVGGSLTATGQLSQTGEACAHLIVGHSYGTATLDMIGGALAVGSAGLSVGDYGTGTLNQTSGTLTSGGSVRIGSNPSTALYALTGGTLRIARGTSRKLSVGGSYATGTLNLGNATATGQISETGSGGGVSLIVREYSTATGTVEGWGTVGLTGALDNSGKVIANGYGTNRTLTLSSFTTVSNTFGNTTTNGWYAVNQGRLSLPAVPVSSGPGVAVNWGESPADTTPDLINSVRLTFNSVSAAGSLTIYLDAPDRTGVPFVDAPMGIWNISASPALAFDTATLTFRYDDALATALGLNEADICLYHYLDGAWQDVTTGINTSTNRIWASGIDAFSYFAIGFVVPEPASAMILAAAGLAMAARRRPRGADRSEKHRHGGPQ